MDIYVIGGAVRDVLLGLQPKDLDYVVVDGSHEEMVALNFIKVGAHFPVYLHPSTGDEYALARTETKQGLGYLGFDTATEGVSLSEDQGRRDITINQLAVHSKDWEIFKETKDETLVFDAFGGIADLKAGILRHTSEAFSDDPIRVLRCARLSARYNFEIHHATLDLMKKVVPELSTVPKERVWLEIEKGLMEDNPINMFVALRNCGATIHHSPLSAYAGIDFKALSKIEKHNDICVRFSLISSHFTDVDYELYRVPSNCAKVSKAFNRHYSDLLSYCFITPKSRLQMLENMRAIGDTWLLDRCIQILKIKIRILDDAQDIVALLRSDLCEIKKVDAAFVVASCTNKKDVKQTLFNAHEFAMINKGEVQC